MTGKAIIAVVLSFVLEGNTGQASDARIAQLIEHVHQNEQHYANVNLTFRKDYCQFEPALAPDQAKAKP